MYKLHRIERFRLQGHSYETWVFRNDKGYTVQTQLGINESSVMEASRQKHYVITGGCCQSRYWPDNCW